MVRPLILAFLLIATSLASEIENPGFFLKVSKNVPRIGRRSESRPDFNMMYMNAKNILPQHRREQVVSPNNYHLNQDICN